MLRFVDIVQLLDTHMLAQLHRSRDWGIGGDLAFLAAIFKSIPLVVDM